MIQNDTPAGAATRRALPHPTRGLLRLTLDLHDGPLQELTAVGFALTDLERLLGELPADTAAAATRLAEIRAHLGSVEAGMRTLATKQGIDDDVRSVHELVAVEVKRFRQIAEAAVHVQVEGDVDPATASQRIAIHRLVREALTNAARHSDAANVWVRLRGDADGFEVEVADDGVGFDLDTVGDGSRLGLAGMRRRLELLEGTLEVSSAPGGPTQVVGRLRRWRPGDARALA